MKSGKEIGLLSARRRTRAATALTSDFVAIGAAAGSFIVTGFGKVLALETTETATVWGWGFHRKQRLRPHYVGKCQV